MPPGSQAGRAADQPFDNSENNLPWFQRLSRPILFLTV